ncbi:MAG: hypothetical protein AAF735_03755 [Myxococcota bacterium]
MLRFAVGMLLGVFVSSAVWIFSPTPWSSGAGDSSRLSDPDPFDRAGASGADEPEPSVHEKKSDPLSQEGGPHHGLAMSEAARATIRAFKNIHASLKQDRLDGIRDEAITIARFFAPINRNIARRAVALAGSCDVETARAHFKVLTDAMQRRPLRAAGVEL